jgi:hypothetical protein
MSDEKNIEQSPEGRKSGSPEEIHENQTVNIELETTNEERPRPLNLICKF